jgi:hypothetical protein
MLKSNIRLSTPAAQPKMKFNRKLADNVDDLPGNLRELILQYSGVKVEISGTITRIT